MKNPTLTVEDLQKAGALLRAGEVVAFPTETVYGLGANALDEIACAKIFALKGRPADNPLIIHIASLDMLDELTEITPMARKLAKAFWPGPLTMVLPKKPGIPDIVSAGLYTVGIRFPSHPTAQELIRSAGQPIAAPSANLSGRPSPTTAKHVAEDFIDQLLILDSGPVEIGLESTVIDVSGEHPILLRPGFITINQLEKILDQKVRLANLEDARRPAAPGMKYRHYAPKGDLRLVTTRDQALKQHQELRDQHKTEPLCILTEHPDQSWPDHLEVFLIAKHGDLETYARNMFAALRYADSSGYQSIIMEAVPAEGLGLAIMNRLEKAAKKA
ncbi:L-threonylcarbamoyladenylate synthase [Candidatus Saccharibacteria bacterium]|nr:L-threonylcarbamoyladenylate synthase [Candidatus Saccharibacteria bacterium]